MPSRSRCAPACRSIGFHGSIARVRRHPRGYGMRHPRARSSAPHDPRREGRLSASADASGDDARCPSAWMETSWMKPWPSATRRPRRLRRPGSARRNRDALSAVPRRRASTREAYPGEVPIRGRLGPPAEGVEPGRTFSMWSDAPDRAMADSIAEVTAQNRRRKLHHLLPFEPHVRRCERERLNWGDAGNRNYFLAYPAPI